MKIKQTRSRIRTTKAQKDALNALGLRKLNRIMDVEDTPVNRGNLRIVRHLIEVVEE